MALLMNRTSCFTQRALTFKPVLLQLCQARPITQRRTAIYCTVPAGSVDIFVGSLRSNAKKDEIEQLFTPYGPVERIDMGSGRFKGFAAVMMPADSAEAAIEALNGTEVNGRTLKVEKRKSKAESDDYKAAKLAARKADGQQSNAAAEQ